MAALDQQIKPINNTPPAKPTALVFNEAKTVLAEAINVVLRDYELPFWLVDVIINELSQEVKTQAQKEMTNAQITWQRQMQHYDMMCAKAKEEETVDETTEIQE